MLSQRLIDTLQSFEKQVLTAIENVPIDRKAEGNVLQHAIAQKHQLIAATKDLYKLLNATFGLDVLQKKPSQLTGPEKDKLAERISQFNFQIRLYYQGVFGTLEDQPGNGFYDRMRTALAPVCAFHSSQLKDLFDEIVSVPLEEIVIDPKKPLLRTQSKILQERKSSHSTAYTWNSGVWNPSFSTSFDFWYWDGFSAGINGHRPDLFATIFTNNYGEGYWMGRGANALGELLVRHVIPGISHGVSSLIRHAGPAMHAVGDAAEQVVHAIAKVGDCCGKAACNGIESCGQGISACAEGACKCGGCLLESGGAILECVVQSCGATGTCLCEICRGGNCCDASADCCKVIGGAFTLAGTVIVNAWNKVFGKGDDTDPKPTPPDANFAASLGISAEISKQYLTPIKYAWFSAVGIALVPGQLVSAHKLLKNWCNGYKVSESKKLLAAQVGGLGGGYAVGYFIPFGGPNVAFVACLFSSLGLRKTVKERLNRANFRLFGTKNPDSYLLKSDALNEIETKRNDVSSIKLQQAIEVLAGEIEKETRNSKRDQSCGRKFLYYMWGVAFKDNDRLISLRQALRSLHSGDLQAAIDYLREDEMNFESFFLGRSAGPGGR